MESTSNINPTSEFTEEIVIEEEVGHDNEEGLLNEGEYNVEKIVDKKEENGMTLYLVKWDGFPSSENTWEPASNLQAIPKFIEEFESKYAQKYNPLSEQIKINPKHKAARMKADKSPKPKLNYPLEDDMPVKKVKINPQLESGEPDLVIDLEETHPPEQNEKSMGQVKQRPEKKMNDKAKIEQKKPQITRVKDKVGSFRSRDQPKAILGMKPGGGDFYFLVEWEIRSDGTKPENSHVSNQEFRKYNSSFLLDFYESKIVIFSKKKKDVNNKELSEGKKSNEEVTHVEIETEFNEMPKEDNIKKMQFIDDMIRDLDKS